jgi:hypothetical protein
MTLAASGTMSIGGTTTDRSINLELSRAQNATSSMGESALRTLAGVPSGAISISDFYGKSNTATPAFNTADTFYLSVFASGGCSGTLTFVTDGTITKSSTGAGGWGTAPTAYITPTGSTTGITIRCNFTTIVRSGSPTLTVFGTSVSSGSSYDSGTISIGGANKVISCTSAGISHAITAQGYIYISNGTTTVSRYIDLNLQF